MSRIPDFSQIPFQQAPAQGDAEFAAWKEKLKTETGKSFEENFYRTMEQINVAPLYDVNAYKDCEHLHYMAGIPPFLRGPYSTMYVTKPWTVRQYAGFSTAEESNALGYGDSFLRHSSGSNVCINDNERRSAACIGLLYPGW